MASAKTTGRGRFSPATVGQVGAFHELNAQRGRRSPTSPVLLDPLPRASSVPALHVRVGPSPDQDLRPIRVGAETMGRDDGGATLSTMTPMQKQQRMRRAWLAHSESQSNARALMLSPTCTCTPLTTPDSRPISQSPQGRVLAHTTAQADSARSFWAPEMPALVGTGMAIALQGLAADAQELALVALSSRDPSKLDQLAIVLAEILEIATEESHPALFAAIQQAGVQTPASPGETPLLAAPSRHDLVVLLATLSAQITYGVAANSASHAASSLTGEANDQFHLQVAQLRRTLQSRVEVDADHAVTPRFSAMAHAIISKEEQLQRTREVLRSQRDANAASLNRVRKQLDSLQGSKGEMQKVLRRMEDEHVKAEQRWEYKRVCLQEERTRLLELAMKAFCKIVYTDRTSHKTTTLQHGHEPSEPTVLPYGTVELELEPPSRRGEVL
jgi:hypothetical protein